MIRNESEYRAAVERIQSERHRFDEHRRNLQQQGLSAEEVKRVLDPLESFHLQLVEEVQAYEAPRREVM